MTTMQNFHTNGFLKKIFTWSIVAAFAALIFSGYANADDILKAGKSTVDDTFGANSTFAKWLILGEVIVGTFMYIKTKNLMLLGGVIVVVVFTTIGFGLAT